MNRSARKNESCFNHKTFFWIWVKNLRFHKMIRITNQNSLSEKMIWILNTNPKLLNSNLDYNPGRFESCLFLLSRDIPVASNFMQLFHVTSVGVMIGGISSTFNCGGYCFVPSIKANVFKSFLKIHKKWNSRKFFAEFVCMDRLNSHFYIDEKISINYISLWYCKK